MANPQKYYLAHMNEQTGYRATWDPGRPLRIGHIGKLDAVGFFTVYTSLEKEGISPEVLTDTSTSDMDYTSNESVSIGVKASGSIPIAGSALSIADAGFDISFNSDNAVVFQASGYKTHQIVNIAEIEAQVVEKYNNGNWDKEWQIVTQLVEADAATIIISNSSNGRLELKASGNAGVAGLKLTDIALGLTVAREQGSTLKYITQGGLTPLYRIMGIRSPFFGKKHLQTREFAAEREEAPEIGLSIQDFDAAELA